MIRRLFLLLGAVALLSGKILAIENLGNGTYNESPPANTDIPNWNSGWTQPTVQPNGFTYTTGWNYVGSVNGNSAVYVGNGWVLMCAHVSVGTMTLNGQYYNPVPGSTQTFGTADLVMFQVTPNPGLPTLPIRSTDPLVYNSPVAMLGWGHANGNRVPTWGYNTVTNINQSLTPTGTNYTSNDFITLTGTTTGRNNSGQKTTVTNNYEVVLGDSGGGDFIYNGSTQSWELAGVNEADGTNPNFSACVQLDTYATQIQKVLTTNFSIDTPSMPQWGLIALAGMLVCVAQLRIKAGNS